MFKTSNEIKNLADATKLSWETFDRLGGFGGQVSTSAAGVSLTISMIHLVGNNYEFVNRQFDKLSNAVEVIALELLPRSFTEEDKEFSVKIRDKLGGLGSKTGHLAALAYLVFSIMNRENDEETRLWYNVLNLLTAEIAESLYNYPLFEEEDDRLLILRNI